MTRARLSYILLIPLAFLLMGARAIVLADPDPIAVPAVLDEKAVSKAIRMGLAQRGWVVSAEEPGKVDATLNLRSHVARIAITYDKEHVRIAYVSSENLLYEEKKDGRYINRNYVHWVTNVTQEISAAGQVA